MNASGLSASTHTFLPLTDSTCSPANGRDEQARRSVHAKDASEPRSHTRAHASTARSELPAAKQLCAADAQVDRAPPPLPGALESFPRSARDEAFRAFVEGDYEAALEHATHAINDTPDEAAAWRLRGKSLAILDRLPEALDDFSRALSMPDADEKVLVARGMLFLAREQFAAAVDDLMRAVEKQPREPVLYFLLAMARDLNDEGYESVTAAELGLALMQGSARADVTEGIRALQQRRLDDGLRAFCRAQDRVSHDATARLLFAVVAAYSGEHEKAAEGYAWLLERNSDDVVAGMARGLLERATGAPSGGN